MFKKTGHLHTGAAAICEHSECMVAMLHFENIAKGWFIRYSAGKTCTL